MVISENLVKFVARWEGKRNYLYDDMGKGRGNCTIGYGHLVHLNPCTGKDPSEAPFLNGITDDEAMKLFRATLQSFANGVESRLKVPVSSQQFDALVSWAFNVGLGNVDRSALLERLNRGEYDAVPYELARWDKAYDNGALVTLQGLVNRRREEADMWRRGTGTHQPVSPPSAIPPPVQRSAWVRAPKLNVRSGASTNYPVVGMLDYATNIGVISVADGWARVGDSLYVSESWLSYERLEASPTPPPSAAQKRLYVGVHDMPLPNQVASVWRNVNQRGLVVHAMLASDAHLSDRDFTFPSLWREHRRNGGVVVLRVAYQWDNDLPRPEKAADFMRDTLILINRLGGEVDCLQIGNEPDLAHKDYELTPAEVGNVFNTVAAAVKSQYPNIKCGPAPIGWLNWAYGGYMHPADYDKAKWAAVDPNLCDAVFFHAYSQHLNANPDAVMELPQGVFYSERVIENQLASMPAWALSKPRWWVECNPIAHPNAGGWPDDVSAWIKNIVAYAKRQNMDGIAFFRLYRHDAYGRNYSFDKPSVLAALREVQS